MARIGLDAGHGGFDPGAVGVTGLKEKDVTLAITLKVSEILRKAGVDTYLTRIFDEALGSNVNEDLLRRTQQLNSQQINYVISIHINSAGNKDANYISTFIQGKGGEAEKLAKKVQPKLVHATGWPDGGIRVANLHMTRETKMPAILVECGFISNAEQEKQLKDPATQNKLARAIADGILEYLGVEVDIMKEVKVIVKGKEVPGKLIDGKTYVPLRELIEVLNNKISWDGDNKVARVE